MHCTHVETQYAVMANDFHVRGQNARAVLLTGCVQATAHPQIERYAHGIICRSLHGCRVTGLDVD